MNCHFIYDDGNADGTKGGAELTMEGFAACCPAEVALTDLKEAEVVVFGNCVTISPVIIPDLIAKRVIRYHHDLARHEDEVLRKWLDDNAEHVFTSPIHRERYGVAWDHGEREAHIVPPPIDYDRFRPNRETRRHGKREGIVTVASWQNPGKGGLLLSETLHRQGLTADCYGPGPYFPRGDHITHCGEIDQAALPSTLWRYEQFTFLPMEVEPFGRCVAEAWAAGCEILVNNNVGAKWWIENDPAALETAGEDFWRLALNG